MPTKSVEIEKLKLLLKIPISDIQFLQDSVTIFSDEINIGTIPFMIVSDEYSYDDGLSSVNWLNWLSVYQNNKPSIDEKIVELIGHNKITIGLGTFRNLYVYDLDSNLIAFVTCSYENSEWSIIKH